MVKIGVIMSSIAFHRGTTHENWTILLKVTISDVTWGRVVNFEIQQTFTKKLTKLCNFKIINFSSVLNLFTKFIFWGKIWGIYVSKAGCLQSCSFFIITDQYSRQGWAIFALIDHCKIHRSKQSSNVALGAALNFKYRFPH